MAEQQPGLRFDIYERVHLQEELAGIQELNDVELVPHIQVLTQNEQAILKGNLLLTGNYESDDGASRLLEHLIPVEITLPLNRIHRVEDILVEIENFDIDLLSARSLNVTGVLSLQGVEMVSSPPDSWRGEEEITFVHEAEEERVEKIKPAPPAPVQKAPTEVKHEANEQAVPEVPESKPFPPAYEEPLQNEAPAAEAPKVEAESKEVPQQEAASVIPEEKKEKEPKLAFGKKANEAMEVQPSGIKSLISKAGALFHPEKRKEEAEAKAAEEAKGEVIEWKRLFLRTDSGVQEFRKLRMCIVQKEETLESIAKRYQLNPRELQLLNRLGDQELVAGQVLYLPK